MNEKTLNNLLVRLIQERKELKKRLDEASRKLGVIDQIDLEERYAAVGRVIQRVYGQLSMNSKLQVGMLSA